DEFGVVVTDVEGPAGLGGGAALPVRASPAAGSEAGAALGGDRDSVAAGAGGGAGLVVDDEVVAVEPARDRGAQGDGFDGGPVAGPADRDADLPGPVGGVGEHLQAGFLALQQGRAGGAVTGVGRGERAGGDQPGLGFDRHVCLVAVPVGADALV